MLHMTGCYFSRGEGVVHRDITCQKLDISSTQDEPFILSPVSGKDVLNILKLCFISDPEQPSML